MSRPRRFRRVGFEPNITYFKPTGIRMINLEESVLTVDELEAIRLKDLERIEQSEAAKKMNISQPTFHRLILEARKKVADALVNGKAIKIEGGTYKMVQQPIQPGRGGGIGRGRGMGFGGPAMTCKCSSCGYEEPKIRGVRCIDKKCPKCGAQMIRGQ